MKFSDVLILMIKIILNVFSDALYLRLSRPKRYPKIESKMQSKVRLLIGSTRFLTDVGQVKMKGAPDPNSNFTQLGASLRNEVAHGPTLCINLILDIKGK